MLIDALHGLAVAGKKAAQLFSRDQVRRPVLLLEGKVALAIPDHAMAGEVEDIGPVLIHSLLQLLECPQIAGVEGHILAGYGPEERLLLPLVVLRSLIGGRAGHEEQAQEPGSQLATKGFELLLRSRQAADGKEGVEPQEVAACREGAAAPRGGSGSPGRWRRLSRSGCCPRAGRRS